MDVEIYLGRKATPATLTMLQSMEQAIAKAGDRPVRTKTYTGQCPVVMMYGVGARENAPVRDRHVSAGGRAVLFDIGYFGRSKVTGHMRFSIDRDHPQHLLDDTEPKPERWDTFGISLREDYHPDGRVILVGLGHKSRMYLKDQDWEVRKLADLSKRFPKSRILYRPKRTPFVPLPIPHDITSPIEHLLTGASFVSCRHSNVAIDATIAGIPFECEDGAAKWLHERLFTIKNRLDFLRRLCWWNWKPNESREAWAFIRERL